jgi:hypothetical protein
MNAEQIQKAGEIANRAPDLHPWHVALQACNASDDFDGYVVGLLHDSLEDAYAMVDDLRSFPEHVLAAVLTLTRREGETYWDYIERVRQSSALARRVKLADARINLSRCVASGDTSRGKRYLRVIDILTKEEA